jgi:CBS domain-containing protein
VIARVTRTAEEELGSPPCRYAFIVHGSEGRREQTLLTDQDNAIVYQEDGTAARRYFPQLASRVVRGLVQASFPRCAGGFMATNWCRPLTEWESLFESWVAEPEPDALLGAANFFDFRRVWGTLALDPLDRVLERAADNRIFLAHLAAAGLRFRPPIGLFRQLKDDDGGIDLKKGGILPIVSLARVVGLEAQCRSRSTLDRLEAAGDAGLLSSDGAEGLSEAYRYLHRLRLEHQLKAHQAGQPVSNVIPLDDLVSLERRHLKDSFSLIRDNQDWLAQRFDVDRLG